MKNLVSLKLNKEFRRAYFQGRFRAHPFLVTYLIENRLGVQRVGITTGKKIGKAHLRNRARRVIRAAYLSCREEIAFPRGYDLVFVAREQTPAVTSDRLARGMKKQILTLLEQKPAPRGKAGRRPGRGQGREPEQKG